MKKILTLSISLCLFASLSHGETFVKQSPYAPPPSSESPVKKIMNSTPPAGFPKCPSEVNAAALRKTLETSPSDNSLKLLYSTEIGKDSKLYYADSRMKKDILLGNVTDSSDKFNPLHDNDKITFESDEIIDPYNKQVLCKYNVMDHSGKLKYKLTLKASYIFSNLKGK